MLDKPPVIPAPAEALEPCAGVAAGMKAELVALADDDAIDFFASEIESELHTPLFVQSSTRKSRLAAALHLCTLHKRSLLQRDEELVYLRTFKGVNLTLKRIAGACTKFYHTAQQTGWATKLAREGERMTFWVPTS